MKLNDKALEEALEANIDWIYGGDGPRLSKRERKDFKDTCREETAITIAAYLAALPEPPQ